MKQADAQQHLTDFIRNILQKYGRAPVAFGNAFDAVSRSTITAFWIHGDDSKCIAFYRTKYKGQGRFDVSGEIFDGPRPKNKLRPLEGCAFESVTKEHVVAMAFGERAPVHGNN